MSKLDITSTVIEKSIDSVKDFLDKLIGPAIEETGLLIRDPIRLWRFKNQIKILEKAQKIVRDKNIDTKVISVKMLVPFLEFSSLEEEEKLHDKWANLFVNYIDTAKQYESFIFPNILSQLSTNEVVELDWLYENNSILRKSMEIPDSSVANLIRLGLIRQVPSNKRKVRSGLFSDIDYIGYRQLDRFQLTAFGNEFVKCCSSKTA